MDKADHFPSVNPEADSHRSFLRNSTHWLRLGWFLVLLIAFVLTTYSRFSNWMPGVFYGDDLSNLLAFRTGAFASSFGQALTQAFALKFRPVFEIVMGAAFSLFENNITYYLALNVVVQAVSGVLFFFIAYRLSKSNLILALATAIAVVTSRFALYQVTQITGLLMSVSWLLCLLTTFFVLKLVGSKNIGSGHGLRYVIAAVIVSFLAIHTYELYIVIAPVVALAVWLSPGLRGRGILRYATVLAALTPAIFNVLYKVLILHIPFFVGTGGTHMGLAVGRAVAQLAHATASIGGFNIGPEYLVGQSVSRYSALDWVLASTVSVLWIVVLVCGLAGTKPTSRAEATTYTGRSFYPLMFIAVLWFLLLVPPVMTIRVEQRWLFGPFALLLLMAAWAAGQTRRTMRKLATVCVLGLCGASIVLDSQLAQHFGQIYMISSAKFAESARRDIADVDPGSHYPVLLFANSVDCNWVLQKGSFFSIYDSGKREVKCVDSNNFKTMIRLIKEPLASNTKVYQATSENQVIDITAMWKARAWRLARENVLVDFIKLFPKGIISDKQAVSTPTGHGVFLSSQSSLDGPTPTITVVSGFSYQFEDLSVPSGTELRFGISMVYPTRQPAKVEVKVREAGSADYRTIYSWIIPLAVQGNPMKFVPVTIPLQKSGKIIRAVSFGIEPTGNDSSGQWGAFSIPRIVIPPSG